MTMKSRTRSKKIQLHLNETKNADNEIKLVLSRRVVQPQK